VIRRLSPVNSHPVALDNGAAQHLVFALAAVVDCLLSWPEAGYTQIHIATDLAGLPEGAWSGVAGGWGNRREGRYARGGVAPGKRSESRNAIGLGDSTGQMHGFEQGFSVARCS
jgi:hypothetical protein